MSEDFKVVLPKLGESIVSATVVKWAKKVGDVIKLDEPLLEVSTDKVNSEIPSPVSGILKEILVSEDVEVEVGAPLAIIATSQSGAFPVAQVQIANTIKEESENKAQYFSPALLRLAKEHAISIEEVEKIAGSGAGGRITKKDLEEYIARRSSSKSCQRMASKTTNTSIGSGQGEVERIPMSGLRKAIAENMVKSFYEAPHASLITEVDLTPVTKLIQAEKEKFLSKNGFKISITSFVIRAIAKALEEFPLLNSTLEGETIVVKRFVNVGIAVSIDQGLIVPVIKNCHQNTLTQIAKAVADLSFKARTSTLSHDDVKGGTITMSNFGMSGVSIGIPIIRSPEVAIIGMGSIQKKVVAIDDMTFAIRDIMHVSLTFDHRIVDGMYGCGFLNAIKAHLEKDLLID